MLPEDIVLGHGIHPRVDMVTMIEKAQRMRQVEKTGDFTNHTIGSCSKTFSLC